MFAVIKTGGKQYRVAANDVIKIEKLDAEEGSKVTFDNVLMVGGTGETIIGSPIVSGASVAGEVVEQMRDRKIIVFKKRRRQNSRRRNGHRQAHSIVRITSITANGQTVEAEEIVAEEPDLEAAVAETEAPAVSEITEEVTDTAAEAASEDTAETADEAAEDASEAPESPAEAESGESSDDVAEALFEAPEGVDDDLTRISGVGPVLKAKLNGLGITSFAQVAAFTAEDIARVDDALSFKGRIERDDWVSQAKTLAEEAGE